LVLEKGFSQKYEDYPINDEDVRNVTMAGLMHDLGYGPFSHLFDKGVIPTLLNLKNLGSQSI
jgi:HD superfamily phosphohydrolase